MLKWSPLLRRQPLANLKPSLPLDTFSFKKYSEGNNDNYLRTEIDRIASAVLRYL